MGTGREWLSVLIWGGIWGALMVWWTARRLDWMVPRRGERILHLALWAPVAVWFGVLSTFHWRAWHRPLLFVTVGCPLGMFFMAWIFRKKRVIDTTSGKS